MPDSIQIKPCSIEDFELVKAYIQTFELDNRQLQAEEFLIAYYQEHLVGFGRIRNYSDCSELCSLGVIEPERMKGIGSQLCQALIKKARHPLYLVCIIPDFFTSLGFDITNHYPEPLKNKLNYCTQDLPVEETYVVMKLI